MNAHDVIIRPIVSEKSYDLMEQGRYTFEVHRDAVKEQIAQAIEEIFNVRVEKVNTMNVSGKPRRLRYNKGLSRSWKKAIVTLKAGDTIDLFAGR
ncbi:MAG: 50S ribosomal protein L23 [Coriobacteriia bacterium]|jgi:large subunit ribosomal protein L23|nr:50S ribosomal protein L23 [Coriobacteriia bacterium]MDZ4179806.1 50S ribosomal protein L23 [Coriobacteriia bacterium]